MTSTCRPQVRRRIQSTHRRGNREGQLGWDVAELVQKLPDGKPSVSSIYRLEQGGAIRSKLGGTFLLGSTELFLLGRLGLMSRAPLVRRKVNLADTRTPEQRGRIMRSVRQKHTGPELIVRRAAHALGFRFRLHSRELPGRPDLVFPGKRKVIFVHGCFWHGHRCSKGQLPKSRADYWMPKIEGNKERDEAAERVLSERGWCVLTIWQCETRTPEELSSRLSAFLREDGP